MQSQETAALHHDPVKLEEEGRRQRTVGGDDAVTRLLRWKNELRLYRTHIDDEISKTLQEIDRRMQQAERPPT